MSGFPSEDGTIRRRLDADRRSLLETSTRTRLLNTPLGSETAKIVEIENAQVDDLFRRLVHGEEKLAFRPRFESPGEEDQKRLGFPPTTWESRQLPQQEDGLPGVGLQTRLRSGKLKGTASLGGVKDYSPSRYHL